MTVCKLPDAFEMNVEVRFEPGETETNALNEVAYQTRKPTAYTVWASCKTRGSREVYFAEQQHGQVDVVAECEWYSDLKEITSEWRMVIEDEVFELLGKPENVDYKNERLRIFGRVTE